MATRKIRTDRLLKLAAFLETVPRRAFDITDWQTKEVTKPEGKRLGECGFAGCAIGWAAHAKLFRGLTIKHGYPKYGESGSAGDAVERLFEIGQPDVFLMFTSTGYPTLYPTPKQVATRIRKFVRDHAKAGT